MPNNAPAKVAVSPKATSKVSWIWPCGSMKMPQKSRTKPPMERIKADISCKSNLINMSFVVGR